MELDQVIGLFSRWLHIIPVIVLVGGTIFLRLSVVGLDEEPGYAELREKMRQRWAKWIGIAILFILVTGLYNSVMKIMDLKLTPVYHTLVLVKLLVGLFVFYLASVLSGKSNNAKKYRERETHWLNILCGCMIFLALVASYMKHLASVAPKKVKNDTTEETANFRANPYSTMTAKMIEEI